MVKYASIRSVFCMSREPYETNTGNGDGEGNFSFQSNRVDKQQSVRDWDPSPSISLVYMHIQKSTKPIHITYHISHITYHRPQPQPRPRNLTNYTTPYKSGENRTTTNQNGNIQRGTCSADILTYSVHTYLPTYLSSSSFHLPSSIFSFHFSFSCPILRFMLHVSCFMLYVFFVSFFVLHRSIDYLFTQRSTECFFHITEYLCFCT